MSSRPGPRDGEVPRAPRSRHPLRGPSGGAGRAPKGARCDARRRGPGRRAVDGPGRPGGQRVLRAGASGGCHRDTGPIAAVVVDCADPRAMARFWGEATDWTLHEVTDDHARLRSAKGVGPYLEFLRAPGVRTLVGPGSISTWRRTRGTIRRRRWLGCGLWAPPVPTWVRGTCRGRFWPIRRGTSSACWVGAERGRGPGVGRLAGGGRWRPLRRRWPCTGASEPQSDHCPQVPVRQETPLAEKGGPGDEGSRHRPGHRLVCRRRLGPSNPVTAGLIVMTPLRPADQLVHPSLVGR